ncbi:response regulator [Paenibacillus aceris]|uniref:Two-component system response regulator YesN n=1 Tax=Paenibacillus aceris TaxID=869555 RepID=A0ABS4I7E5_9BACL|nr:response regulator [Paenibacillus aceris]MBP1966842.1 two-component system response regulator YesN [Paenibacillus aceris]NHW38915.1 response regulator [Paenibacillus aceris]
MKLILVDDERVIADGLQKMISRYIPECEVIGVAYNGLEGFKLIQKRQPDIVITDIRMPQADGLEMIKMLKEAGCQTKFILLSGYADFEYARRGMQLGVQFYINKPVEELELRDCVCQLMEAIRAEKAKLQEVDDLKMEAHSRIQESALWDILDVGNDNTVQVEELLRGAGIPTEGYCFVCAQLEFDNHLGPLKEFGLDPVFRQVERALGRYGAVYRFRYSGSQVAVVVAHGEDIEYGELVLAVHRLKEAVFRELKLSMTVGIGTVQERAAGICKSFEEARYALSYKVIKGVDAVIPFPEIISLTKHRHPVPEEMIAKLEAGIDNMDEEGCVFTIREIFRWMEPESRMSPADLQLQCLNILLSSVRKMSFQQLEQNDFLGRNILSLEGISRFRTLERLEEWMVQIIREIITFKLEHNIPKKKDIIAEIKDYVSKHYDEPISLADLASRFFISPYYLSQLFKQKTGDTYINFLAQCRIGKAKELLERTDLKVYEICRKVGYSDTQHFARLFEKLTGFKPSEYRKYLPRA